MIQVSYLRNGVQMLVASESFRLDANRESFRGQLDWQRLSFVIASTLSATDAVETWATDAKEAGRESLIYSVRCRV